MRKEFIIILILLLFTMNNFAQFVSFGQDRASLRWKQINTNDFQIIYPDFFEDNAQKIANIYALLYRHTNTLGLKPKKISMILHPDGGVANGNVALAPRKSELYMMPPQDPSDNWLEHLCVHEFRHVIQFDKVNQGLTKDLYYLFGEIFPIAVVGLYVPMWFMEGDAVCFESSVGHLGRGRSPEFLNEMKAQVVEKGVYSFQKAILGSYKDYVPNRYTLGYYMTANSRINYGPDIWAKALTRTGRRPYGLAPFAKSLQLTMHGRRDSLWKDSTFRSLFINPDSARRANTYADAKHTLYCDNFAELQQIWKREIVNQSNGFDTIATHNKYYANYYYPTVDTSGTMVAYKKGLQQTGAFVMMNGGVEKLLTRTGVPDDYKFAWNRNHIVWSEYFPHIRWQQGGRVRLSSYGLVDKKYRRYKSRNNQFAPFVAGNNWGCVEVDNRNRASIVLYDSTLQHEVWRIRAADDELFIHPSYSAGKITTVVESPRGLRLESIDVASHDRRKITEDVYYELDNPVVKDSLLVFRASFNGNNAFYREASDGPLNILNGRYGVNYPSFSPDGKQLYFSFYTSDGYKPGRVEWSDIQENKTDYRDFRLADSMKMQEKWQLPPNTDSIYSTRKYNKFTHLVNIHSWGPLNVGLSDMEVDIGAVVYSQNKLSTLSFTAGYALKSGYDHGAWILNASYSGWWPVIDLNLESGRYDYYSMNRGHHVQTDSSASLYVHNKARLSSVDVTVRLPLNLSARQYNRSLQPYIRYKVEGIHSQRPDQIYEIRMEDNMAWLFPADKEDYRIETAARYYQLMEYGIIYNNQTRMSEQESNPRWGQMLSIGYTHVPLKSMDLGQQWWSDGRLYFPGFCRNHSLSVYGGFQHMSDKYRNYSNKILSPRGISLYGYEISSMRSTYRLPLLYPDKHIGSILYFKNVEGALFYDLGTNRNSIRKSTYSSYGLELTTDTHFFRLTYPIHLGFRAGYETQHKKMFADLIFSIGLSI